VKSSVLLDGAKAPHLAYVGDSILGRDVNLGAGTKLSNLAMKAPAAAMGGKATVSVTIEGRSYDTGRAKLGAILGDHVETGCNAVTNPGCLIGPRTAVYPNASLRPGYYPPDSIVKLRQKLVVIERRKRRAG
jgi:NDP-sugar pyrophosphorylase family protein